MKYLFTFLLIIGLFVKTSATIITVSNDPATVAQFSVLQTAIDAAADGDTIFIHGSPVIYPSINITDKKLALIGPGYAPEKELTSVARIAGGFIRNTAAIGSSNGTEINGLVFTTILRISDPFTGSESVNGLLIQRCQFNSTINIGSAAVHSIGNYLFESNYFNGSGIDGTTVASYSNFIFRNNVFRNALNNRCFGSFKNTANFLVDHNLFYATNQNVTVFDANCENFLITNNIIVAQNASLVKNSVFNNNLTFNTLNNAPWTGINNNINGGGNVENQDPQMAGQPSVNTGTDNPLLDFSIAAGPANNSGSDGKDMGLLFEAAGGVNWTFGRNSRFPRVTKMNILNPTINPNGTLNVQVEAKVSN